MDAQGQASLPEATNGEGAQGLGRYKRFRRNRPTRGRVDVSERRPYLRQRRRGIDCKKVIKNGWGMLRCCAEGQVEGGDEDYDKLSLSQSVGGIVFV